MSQSLLGDLRAKYHRNLCSNLLGIRINKKTGAPYFTNADGDSTASVALAEGVANLIGGPFCPPNQLPSGQASGARFSEWTNDFLKAAFALLQQHRPGSWTFSTTQGSEGITAYDQYQHLAHLSKLAEEHPDIVSLLGGDYLIVPDIVVGREPVSDADIDKSGPVIGNNPIVGRLTPLRASNFLKPMRTLHASISCKWTMRSDRSQNSRTEALNLMRNRKGKSPLMVIVTAEPLPSRLMSIAIGTGDIDCTYHAALYELVEVVKAGPAKQKDQHDQLMALIEGRRLRDISDLPFDLAI